MMVNGTQVLDPAGSLGDVLAAAFSAVLETVTTTAPVDAVDAALGRLHEAAARLGGDLDLQPLDLVAYRAVGRAQNRRRQELSLIAMNQAVAGLWQQLGDAQRLCEAIVETIHRLVPDVDAAWLSVRDGSGAWRGSAAWGIESQALLDSRRAGIGDTLDVPLTGSGSVTAMLHVARRDGTPFGPDETAIVHRFAKVAALPLNAVMAWSECVRRNDDLTARLSDLDNSAAMVDGLLRLTAAAEPPLPSAVAKMLATGLDAVAVLIDQGGRPIAGYPAGPAGAASPDLLRRAAAESGEVVVEPGSAPAPYRYAVAITTSARSEGTLLIVRAQPLSDDALVGLRRAAQVVAMLRLRQNALLHAYEELRTDLLSELLSARRPLPRPVRILAEARRFPLDRPCVVVAVEDGAALGQIVADIAGTLGGVGGRHDDLAVAVLPGDDPRAAAEIIAARIKRVNGATPAVCASDPAEPATGALPEAFEAARHGLAVLRAVGPSNRSATTRELALFRPLFDPDRSGEVQDLLAAALRPLLDYEREQKVDLVETVRVFLATGSNASQAARRLYIHPNTMAKRLDRVTRLLGDNWQDGVDGLRLRLALHLRSLGTESGEDLVRRAG